jgi:beta-mannosidase
MPDFRKRELSGPWEIIAVNRFSDAYDFSNSLRITVPSHWQQHPDLCAYAGKVVYRRRFSWRKVRGRRVHLSFPGIFYWSAICLNGKTFGAHEGYFESQVYDVTADLKAENELIVEVDCPDEKDKTDKRMITGIFSHWDCLDPATNPGGIWLTPFLRETGEAHVTENMIHTERIDDQGAHQVERLTIHAEKNLKATVTTTYEPENFQGDSQAFVRAIELHPGDNSLVFRHTILNPRLWWTHDLGKPNLYRVRVRIDVGKAKLCDQWDGVTGLRTVKFQDWICHLNGTRLYLKGNNLPPIDTRIAAAKKKTAQKDFRLAAKAHMNIMRVHAHVSHPMLYEAADRAGMLLWQDMPLQWVYRKEVLHEVIRQGRAMVKLLYNHPCVAIWCCHNESFSVVDTDEENPLTVAGTLFSMLVFSWNRDVMDKHNKKSIEKFDPTRKVVRSSGEMALLGKKGTDLHFYGGWYRIMGTHRAFDWVLKFVRKGLGFVTEFGAQSFPDEVSSKRFMNEDMRKIDWKTLEDRHSLQLDLMDHWTPRDRYKTLGEYIQATQDYQSEINRYYIDRIRTLKYDPNGGVMPFMFVDPNPAIQWSVVDYWRRPKSSYYKMADALRPVYAFALLPKDEYRRGESLRAPVYVVNDTQKSFPKARIEVRVFDDENREAYSRSFTHSTTPDCRATQVGVVDARAYITGKLRIEITLKNCGKDFVNVYETIIR